jgi:hypothetical protein
LVPTFGSLEGINVRGDTEAPKFSDGGHLLVFAIHHERGAIDVKFWNDVIHLVKATRQETSESMEYWGICDAGAECNGFQSVASFTILGYLDPLEMRVVADADARGEALLYDHLRRLKAQLVRGPDPTVEANLVLQRAK